MKKLLKYTAILIGSLILSLLGISFFLYFTADMKAPTATYDCKQKVIDHGSYQTCGESQFRHSESGLWEIKLVGNSFERGEAFGKLSKDLLEFQEKVFVEQIREIIPSDRYLKFLRFFTIIFNRNIANYIPDEFREEIYAMSQSCSDKYNAIGTPYERQLNYHAAHDIGHAMQDYMLVGCSSFGVWGGLSADSSLIIGRNFDFYVGDAFAQNKLVTFYFPTTGYKFAAVGWGGMTGVLSGMNEAGLTITINAAKSTVPTSAAMPISLLAREILQYASTIDEAYAIAQKRSTFVAEALLIGSAKDKRAAIIEKATDKIALFNPGGSQIICTNHYQSDTFSQDERNLENISTSDSPYRYKRLEELLNNNYPIDPLKAASILRNRFGKNNEDIGLANEKALNQFIAHHSVIFKPEKGMMWVSTSPWQSGKYVAYDLKKIFANADFSKELCEPDMEIKEDTILSGPVYQDLLRYRALSKVIRKSIKQKQAISNDSIQLFIQSNPRMYHAYELAGDYLWGRGEQLQAKRYWEKALQLEIPKVPERQAIEKKIKNN